MKEKVKFNDDETAAPIKKLDATAYRKAEK